MNGQQISMPMGLCPTEGCGNPLYPNHTNKQWRQFVEAGVLPGHCILCNGDFEHSLSEDQKAGILRSLDSFSS